MVTSIRKNWNGDDARRSPSATTSADLLIRLLRLVQPGRDLAATREAELGEHVLDVIGHGSLGEHEPGRDLAVRPAQGDQPGDFTLPWCERVRARRQRMNAFDPRRHTQPARHRLGRGEQTPTLDLTAQRSEYASELHIGLDRERDSPDLAADPGCCTQIRLGGREVTARRRTPAKDQLDRPHVRTRTGSADYVAAAVRLQH